MVDREKVLKGLEGCSGFADCDSCPYNNSLDCICDLMTDALKLLQEQPEVAETKVVRLFMLCPECGEPILNGWKHCAHCGAKLEEGEA